MYQNAAEVIALAVMNLACSIFAALEVIDGKRWLLTLRRISEERGLPLNTKPIQTAFYVEIVMSIMVGLFAIAFAYLSYAVVREFGWVIYKKIGADIAIQRKALLLLFCLCYITYKANWLMHYNNRHVQNTAIFCARSQN